MTNPGHLVASSESPSRAIQTVVEIAAPPERVFEALTDPRELAAWWCDDAARSLECDADPRPGGSWRVRTIDRDGAERTFSGEYRVVDAPRHLEQSWQASDDEQPSVVRYDLEPLIVDGTEGTRLTVTHTESFPVSSISALASRFADQCAAVRTRRHVLPAWFRSMNRTWARRVLS